MQSDDFSFEMLMDSMGNDNPQLIRDWLNACDDPTMKSDSNFISKYCVLLLVALDRNCRVVAKFLINSGHEMKIGFRHYMERLLQRSVKNDDIEITTMLLSKKDNIDISEKDCISPLLNTAIANRSVDMVKLLVRNSADVNYTDNRGISVLQLLFENSFQNNVAIQVNDERVIGIVKFLLLQGASVTFRSMNGQTALHYAVRFGQKEVLHTILQKTNNVNAISLSNETPLHILLLIDENSEEDILDTVSLFVLKGARADIPNYHNETVCHIAARRKYVKVLQSFILQCQSDINFCDVASCTVLHRILENSITFGDREDYKDLVNLMILREPFCNIKNQNGKTPLHIATENKQYEILYNMLFRVEYLNVPDNDGDTVLHVFLKNLDNNFNFDDIVDVTTTLLSRGANVDVANKMRLTPVHLAIDLKNMKLLSLVLKYSNDLNNISVLQGRSILHIFSTTTFIESNDTKVSEVVEMCIKKGATVDLTDISSQTPLALAVLSKNVAMVKILLQYGANPNARFDFNKTVMHNLLVTNSEVDVEIAEILLAHGMEVDKPCLWIDLSDFKNRGDLFTTLVTHMKDLTKYNVFQRTMLHSVLQFNKFISRDEEERLGKFVTLLLSKGCPVEAKTALHKTALHLAVENKHNTVVKILLQHGADPKALCFNKNSMLHLISMQNIFIGTEDQIIKMIVQKGCSINTRNTLGFTPFLLAAKSGSAAVLRALIKHKANVQCTVGRLSDSALHLSATENNWSVIEMISNSGVDIHAQRRDGKTALHLAAAHAQYPVTKTLLDCGADPDSKDNDGRTPLHVACWNNSLDNVTCLLEYGADVNVMDKFQAIPLMLAQNSDGMIQQKLIYHVKKLEIMRMYVSPLNRELVGRYQNPTDMLALEGSINEEMKGMSQIVIEKNIPLSDVFQMGPRRLCALKNNKVFMHLIKTPFIQLKFPHVGYMVKGHYRRGLIRDNFLNRAKVSLKALLGFELPDICCKKIFMYLSNENLQKLVMASKVVFRKRKRPIRLVVDSSKRVKRVLLCSLI